MVSTSFHSQALNTLANPYVLVVDDEELIRKAMVQTLIQQGYNVLAAESGESAIQLLEANPIGVIICGLKMKGLSGVDVLSKALQIQPDAVRIILTGSHDLNSLMAAVNYAHANQILLKPWEDLVLSQTVRSSLETYRLLKENERLHQLALKQHEDLKITHNNLKQELRVGARIHEILLMGQIPEHVPGICIDVESIASKEIDGDFFEFYQPADVIVDLILGDVMGKGLPAALIGTALKAYLMQYKVFKKIGNSENNLLTPTEIITYLHKSIVPKLVYLEYFASVFYGRFHLTEQTFTFVDCGSTKPIHYSAKNQKASPLIGCNLPLGTVDEQIYHSQKIEYSEGDLFIFYSDGVTEAQSPKKELYGSERIIDIAKKHPNASPKEIISLIKSSVISFAEKSVFDDDLTLIVIKMYVLKK